jgi:putative transposase
MSGLQIRPGHPFLYQGDKIVFLRRATDVKGTYVFMTSTGLPVTFATDEIFKLRETDQLKDWVEQAIPQNGGHPMLVDVGYDLSNQSEKREADRKLQYCMEWAAVGAPRSDAGLQPIIEKVHEQRVKAARTEKRFECSAPSVATLQRWIRDWLARGQNIDSLVPNVRLRGNRRPRIRFDVQELMNEAIDDFYLTRQRLSVAAVHRELERLVHEENKRRVGMPRLPVPTYNALQRAIGKLCEFTVDFCRMGSDYAREKWRGSGSGYSTTHANQIWEIDDTRADTICTGLNRYGQEYIIGRPWITMVIDRHTRMIMSVVISFHPPDTTTAMEAVRIAIHSKDQILQDLGLPAEYQARGAPDAIHVDNGKPYNSKAFKRALAHLGIQHLTMPVLHAWYKGVVERGFGTLSRQVFHSVAGSTFSGIYERDRQTPPEEVAKTSISEMRRLLWKWIVSDYQNHHHKGIDERPCDMWRVSMAKTPQRIPPTKEKIDSALQLTVARIVRKEGLQYQYLKYNSAELAELRIQLGSNTQEEIVVRVNRTNLETIQYLNPITNEWHPAFLYEAQLPIVQGRTLEEYQEVRAIRANRDAGLNDMDPHWVQSYEEIYGKKADLEDAKQLGKRQQAAAFMERGLKKFDRQVNPNKKAKPVEGQDFSSQVNEAAEAHLKAKDTTPRAPIVGFADDIEQWGAQHRLKTRIQKPKKETD